MQHFQLFKLSLQLIELRRAALKHTGTILIQGAQSFFAKLLLLLKDLIMIYSISEVQLEEIPGGTFWWCSAS